MASAGFIELLRLADLAKTRLAQKNETHHHQWTGIGFLVAGQSLVAPMGEVSEILAMPDFTVVPLTKPWLLGVANVRGRLLPLVDLARFLGLQSQGRTKDAKVMVIDQDGVFSGIVIDQVLGMMQFSYADYQARRIAPDSPFAPYNHGVFVKETKDWFVMLLSLLFSNPDYLDATI